jgi:hypothetical protein
MMKIEEIQPLRFIRFDVSPMVSSNGYLENSNVSILTPEEDDEETPKDVVRLVFKVDMSEIITSEEAIRIISEFTFRATKESYDKDLADIKRLANHFRMNFEIYYQDNVLENSLRPMPFLLPTESYLTEMLLKHYYPDHKQTYL